MNLCADSHQIVRAVSFSAVQQFGIIQSEVEGNLVQVDSIFTNYASQRSVILFNKTRDRQWTEIIQVICSHWAGLQDDTTCLDNW